MTVVLVRLGGLRLAGWSGAVVGGAAGRCAGVQADIATRTWQCDMD